LQTLAEPEFNRNEERLQQAQIGALERAKQAVPQLIADQLFH
jgi:hypothetical protein